MAELSVPEKVLFVAEFLVTEGYRRAEAYPIEKWRAKGWSEEKQFFDAVDACIKLMIALGRQVISR